MYREFMKSFPGEIYLVGGAVRDIILNNSPRDIDFTTPKTPEEVKQSLLIMGVPNHEINMSNSKMGLVVYKDYEITSFRKETYGGLRVPIVEFITDIYEDSLRRDFNVNALYMDTEGKIYDFHEALNEDNTFKTVKSIIDFDISVRQDPLRIIRYLRTLVTVGQKVYYHCCPDNLFLISSEKVVSEINKSIESKEFLELLREQDIYRYIIPFCNNGNWHVFEGGSWLDIFKETTINPSLDKSINTAKITKVMRMMNFSNKDISTVLGMYT